eukprot:1158730-Pelagomonas_calceolata.AAC.3
MKGRQQQRKEETKDAALLAALKAAMPGCVVAELKPEDAAKLGLASGAHKKKLWTMLGSSQRASRRDPTQKLWLWSLSLKRKGCSPVGSGLSVPEPVWPLTPHRQRPRGLRRPCSECPPSAAAHFKKYITKKLMNLWSLTPRRPKTGGIQSPCNKCPHRAAALASKHMNQEAHEFVWPLTPHRPRPGGLRRPSSECPPGAVCMEGESHAGNHGRQGRNDADGGQDCEFMSVADGGQTLCWCLSVWKGKATLAIMVDKAETKQMVDKIVS